MTVNRRDGCSYMGSSACDLNELAMDGRLDVHLMGIVYSGVLQCGMVSCLL